MGKRKSEVFSVLAHHLAIQYSVVLFGLLLVAPVKVAAPLAGLNMLIHGVIDWNIWRMYKRSAYHRIKNQAVKDTKFTVDAHDEYPGESIEEQILRSRIAVGAQNWKYWEDHWFYATIGFDQLLHMATLTLLYGALS